MPRSSRKTKPLSENSATDGKRISIRTDIDPTQILDPESETAITLELQKINDLRESGAEKPAEISWGDWMGPKKMSPQSYVIANLIAMGMTPGEIAAETRLPPGELSVLLQNTLIKAYANNLTSHYKTDSKKRFETLIPNAIRVFEEVLSPFSQENTRLKVDVANKVMERQWGRPQGDVADAGGTVLNLLRELKEINHSAHKDPYERAIEIPNTEISNTQSSKATPGSVSDLLNHWEESDNESNEQNDEESTDQEN
jgi:hypothetical protein